MGDTLNRIIYEPHQEEINMSKPFEKCTRSTLVGLSISDDDLCATCKKLQYHPGEMSYCTSESEQWPGEVDEGGDFKRCEQYDPISDGDKTPMNHPLTTRLRVTKEDLCSRCMLCDFYPGSTSKCNATGLVWPGCLGENGRVGYCQQYRPNIRLQKFMLAEVCVTVNQFGVLLPGKPQLDFPHSDKLHDRARFVLDLLEGFQEVQKVSAQERVRKDIIEKLTSAVNKLLTPEG